MLNESYFAKQNYVDIKKKKNKIKKKFLIF